MKRIGRLNSSGEAGRNRACGQYMAQAAPMKMSAEETSDGAARLKYNTASTLRQSARRGYEIPSWKMSKSAYNHKRVASGNGETNDVAMCQSAGSCETQC